jgi:hypothetical protein
MTNGKFYGNKPIDSTKFWMKDFGKSNLLTEVEEVESTHSGRNSSALQNLNQNEEDESKEPEHFEVIKENNEVDEESEKVNTPVVDKESPAVHKRTERQI